MATEDRAETLEIPTAEKRREGGKHYVYELVVTFSVSGTRRLWRRYSQFDALRETLSLALKSETELPRLTRKLYLKRSSVHDVVENRRPKLLAFMRELLRMQDNPVIAGTLRFFLTPTAGDAARARTPDADEERIVFEDTPTSGQNGPPLSPLSPVSPGSGDMQPMRVRALYDYAAQDEGQLTVVAGDELLLEVSYSDGWCECRLRGEMGLVPESYVEAIDQSGNDGGADGANGSLAATLPGTDVGRPAPTSAREELISSERNYVAMLQEVRDTFFPRLRDIVTAVEGKQFFNNYAELIPFHEAMLADMEKAGGRMGEVLAHRFGLMKDLYARYCAGIPAAQNLYQQKLLDKRFVKFEAGFPQLSKPTLNHFMRPFQRVLKYPLLTSEILKQSSTLEMTYWQRANAAAEDLTLTANKQMTAEERMQGLKISGPDASSFQHVVKGTDEQHAEIRRKNLPVEELNSLSRSVEAVAGHQVLPKPATAPPATPGTQAKVKPPKPPPPKTTGSQGGKQSKPAKPPPPKVTWPNSRRSPAAKAVLQPVGAIKPAPPKSKPLPPKTDGPPAAGARTSTIAARLAMFEKSAEGGGERRSAASTPVAQAPVMSSDRSKRPPPPKQKPPSMH